MGGDSVIALCKRAVRKGHIEKVIYESMTDILSRWGSQSLRQIPDAPARKNNRCKGPDSYTSLVNLISRLGNQTGAWSKERMSGRNQWDTEDSMADEQSQIKAKRGVFSVKKYVNEKKTD